MSQCRGISGYRSGSGWVSEQGEGEWGKEGFREELTLIENVSAKLLGFALLGVTYSALGPSPTSRKLSFCQLSL